MAVSTYFITGENPITFTLFDSGLVNLCCYCIDREKLFLNSLSSNISVVYGKGYLMMDCLCVGKFSQVPDSHRSI
jgi:hypothetical protein